MTAGRPTKPIRTNGFQQPKGRVFPMVFSALLATQVFIEDARADSSPNLLPHSPSYSLSSAQTSKRKSRASSTGQQTRGCWEMRRRGGRWKRTNVCFLEGKKVGP